MAARMRISSAARRPALLASDSVSWKIFKNPLGLYIGGVTAVVLQLAEPRVGSGVWQYTSFRQRPLERLQRTGHAAMMTVYGPRSRTEQMIAAVTRLHARVRGIASDGRAFCASHPELLEWVHATAALDFSRRTTRRQPLAALERDRFYSEGRPAQALRRQVDAEIASSARGSVCSHGRELQRSDIALDFLRIMPRVPALPAPLQPLQGVLVKAAIEVIPAGLRDRIGLGKAWSLAPGNGASCAAPAMQPTGSFSAPTPRCKRAGGSTCLTISSTCAGDSAMRPGSCPNAASGLPRATHPRSPAII